MKNKYFILILSSIFALSMIIHFLTDSSSQKLVKDILRSHVDEIIVDENYTNFKELSQKMTGLNFKIQSTNDPELKDLRMIGARYFNHNESIGAQIKYRDDAQNVLTLYEFKSDEDLESLSESVEVEEKIYKVKLWREGDLYFLIVRSLKTPSNL